MVKSVFLCNVVVRRCLLENSRRHHEWWPVWGNFDRNWRLDLFQRLLILILGYQVSKQITHSLMGIQTLNGWNMLRCRDYHYSFLVSFWFSLYLNYFFLNISLIRKVLVVKLFASFTRQLLITYYVEILSNRVLCICSSHVLFYEIRLLQNQEKQIKQLLFTAVSYKYVLYVSILIK